MSIKIETERLILREFTDNDAAEASYNSKQPTVAHFMSDMILENEQKRLALTRFI